MKHYFVGYFMSEPEKPELTIMALTCRAVFCSVFPLQLQKIRENLLFSCHLVVAAVRLLVMDARN